MGVAKIFDWGGQITNLMQERHQKFLNEKLFAGQRNRWMENQKQGPVFDT